ncbi:MAG TPA: carboxypeptidase regulatory-like domain-containing protein, partial [bacterium]|nr:carboxypeptidase regulatory-like domain-containing protein [bacterium]
DNLLLKYATNASGSWATSSVTTVGSQSGFYNALAIDSADNPHIAFSQLGDLMYTVWSDTDGWATETVDDAAFYTYVALALDGDDSAHIAYFDWTNSDLRYTTNMMSEDWASTTVDSTNSTGQYPDIVVDDNEYAYIAYRYGTGEDTRYATNASGSWVVSTIDTDYYAGINTKIAFDSADHVHITAHTSWRGVLRHYIDNPAWTIEDVAEAGIYGQYNALAVDSTGVAHVSYWDRFNIDLRYASNSGDGWTAETIDSDGSFTDIAIDSNDKVHISYFYGSPLDGLKYATNASGSWVTETVDGDDEATPVMGKESRLALDADDKAHIVYQTNIDNSVKYATNASGAWASEVLATNAYRPDIAIDSNDKAHVCYYDSANLDLIYATNASGSWVTETVESDGSVGWYCSIAVDAGDHVHVAYAKQGAEQLRYAANATGSWVTETIATSVNSAKPILRLDDDGYVHILYQESTNGDLRYATDMTGAWVNTVIDWAGNIEPYLGFEVTGDGTAHASVFVNDTLLYETFPLGYSPAK